MTRAQFIKNMGLFGVLLTAIGYNRAIAIEHKDKSEIRNDTIFNLNFYSDRYGKKYDCEKLVNNINDYFRSNKKPNKQQILESGRFFHQQFRIKEKLIGKIERGTSGLSTKQIISEIEDYCCLAILAGKSHLLLGDGRVVCNWFHNVEHLFICLGPLNAGKNNKFPKGLKNKFAPYCHKEMGETYLKTEFNQTNAKFHLSQISHNDMIKYFPKKEIDRFREVTIELKKREFAFHPLETREKLYNQIDNYIF